MSPRVYVRKFDWEEARRLYGEGLTIKEIAERLGVSYAGVHRVLVPERMEYDRERNTRWQRSGVCPDCGGRSTRKSREESSRCMSCRAKAMATTVRENELRCSTCKEWKPDSAFPRNRTDAHRRGRHAQCTACNTIAKRDYRRRHPEYKG